MVKHYDPLHANLVIPQSGIRNPRHWTGDFASPFRIRIAFFKLNNILLSR